MNLGSRIKYLRTRKGMTQEELGKIIGVSKVSVSGYENNTRQPDNQALVKIADYFGVTTDYLLGRPEPDDGLRVAAHLSDDYDSLPESQKREVQEYIKFKTAQYRKEHQDKKD